MEVAAAIGAQLAASCPGYNDPEFEALLARYVDFKANYNKVSQLVRGAGLQAQAPEYARQWIRRTMLVSFQAMLLELHFNAPRRVWTLLRSNTRRLFGVLYMRTADFYLEILMRIGEARHIVPPVTDFSDPKTLHSLGEPDAMGDMYESYVVLLEVLFEQRDVELENDAAWRPTTAHLEEVMNEYASRILELREEGAGNAAATSDDASQSWWMWFIPVGVVVGLIAYRLFTSARP